MLTNCLAECAHLTITVSEIERYIGRKSSFFHTPLHSTPPLGGFPSEHRHAVWYGKTRMMWLPDGEKIPKIPLFVLAQLTNVTDGQTPGDGNSRAMHSIARQKLRRKTNVTDQPYERDAQRQRDTITDTEVYTAATFGIFWSSREVNHRRTRDVTRPEAVPCCR